MVEGLMHGGLAAIHACDYRWIANVLRPIRTFSVESRHRYIWDQITMVEALRANPITKRLII